MNDYKPNSNRFKEEQKAKNTQEKRVEKPVVTGKVVAKKKGLFSKLSEEFISEDAKNVKSYVFGEVLIPAIKKAISDIVTDGIDMILYGGSRGDRKRGPADTVSYRNYYDRGGRSARDTRAVSNTRYSTDDVVLSSRAEAEEVLDRMFELLDTYTVVRVADLYDLVGITGSYTDNNYGWTSLRTAEIVRVRDGYIIKMPRAVPID